MIILGFFILNQLNFIEHHCQTLYKRIENKSNLYNVSDLPFIFIGGHTNTGTDLMGNILDTHSMVRCRPKPIITKFLLRYRKNRLHSMERLVESGITATVLNNAVAAFIATIIKEIGPRTPRLCHNDLESFDYLEDLNILFPKGKFIHIVQDGRATIASEIANINSNYTSENITEAILTWDDETTQILEDCENIGNEKCLTVRYECLVLNPLREIQKVLYFLELPWDEKLLRYGTDSSRTDQLVHNNSLDAWSKANSLLSEEHIEFMNENCLALKQLGYLTDEIPPNYATICNI
ncbi:protein-tyrosine sulfotransferase [Schistosoma bovis]|uniref:Protein-tyrosine sulfotransferase n=1 Tax=Schistosoma bovis TaxID=6184 RepID=A0A430QAT2_SCHBO|nr:protein-tyrosine sulfotransferase [Schistosoma bovis]